MTNQCTSVVGHFDGHGGAPEQYRWHHPKLHVQGYPRSHCMPPSGDYLLHIATAAARPTANETKMRKCTNFAVHFNGRSGVLVQYRMHCSMKEVPGFGRSQ
jgi:hypothetical protein